MRRRLILFMLLSQLCSGACFASSLPDASGNASTASMPQARELSPTPPKFSCSSALPLAEIAVDGSMLSAFKLFNPYPPKAQTPRPGEVTLGPQDAAHAALLECLPEGSFQFTLLVDGILVEGGPSHIRPLSIWEFPGPRYLATYIHKNYEMEDGEGVAVEISGLIIDSHGKPITPIQDLSSWYEYEGAIRVRDLLYVNGLLVTTEEIFFPTEHGASGEALGYFRERPRETIKEYGTRMPDTSSRE